MKESKKVNKTIKKEVKVKVTECSEGLSDAKMGEKSIIDICTDSEEYKKEIMKSKTKDIINGIMELTEYLDCKGVLGETSNYLRGVSTMLGMLVACGFSEYCDGMHKVLCNKYSKDYDPEDDLETEDSDSVPCNPGDCKDCLFGGVYSDCRVMRELTREHKNGDTVHNEDDVEDMDMEDEVGYDIPSSIMVELPCTSVVALRRFIEDSFMDYIVRNKENTTMGFVCSISNAYEVFSDASDFVVSCIVEEDDGVCDCCCGCDEGDSEMIK